MHGHLSPIDDIGPDELALDTLFSRVKNEEIEEIILDKHNSLHVELGDWHQITNPYDETCKIIEIQYGKETSEDDIERLHYYNGE